MSSELSVAPIGSTPAAPEMRAGGRTILNSAPVSATDTLAPGSPNPMLVLDAQLGMVVIQFRAEDGSVTQSIPTAQQLEAYRTWNQTHIGPRPAGAPGADLPTHTPVKGAGLGTRG
jgi:hypothetical protein